MENIPDFDSTDDPEIEQQPARYDYSGAVDRLFEHSGHDLEVFERRAQKSKLSLYALRQQVFNDRASADNQ